MIWHLKNTVYFCVDFSKEIASYSLYIYFFYLNWINIPIFRKTLEALNLSCLSLIFFLSWLECLTGNFQKVIFLYLLAYYLQTAKYVEVIISSWILYWINHDWVELLPSLLLVWYFYIWKTQSEIIMIFMLGKKKQSKTKNA